MNEVEFRNWMDRNNVKKKVKSDLVSRLKRIEKELDHCDLDEAYRKDKCQSLMELFLNKGENEDMRKYPNANFPVGKDYMGIFRYALRWYVRFCDCIDTEQ